MDLFLNRLIKTGNKKEKFLASVYFLNQHFDRIEKFIFLNVSNWRLVNKK